ncbi:MAG: restriction endonuclease subunit S [Acinetobacter sp.]|nr:restriction endonuclease subunit S [Acinetobacter sp.]MDN5649446.1 restriction endonuclease subunit S [Acinetobacter sp.]
MASPKLRFKEFDSEWALQNLGSLFSKRRDKGISGVPTYSVTLNNGIVNRDDLERDTPTNLSPQEHLLVKKNDLAYNMMRMWQGALGLAPTDGIVSPAYVVLKPSEQKTNSNFFEYYFKRNRQIHNFWAYSQGLTEDRLRLYFDDFKVIKINAPSKEEQTKIASFLSGVDEKIAQLTQKHKLLRQYKQGMMQKLFSQQIRFKADDGSEFREWDQKELKDVAQINPKAKKLPENFIYIDLESVEKGQLLLEKNITLNEAPSRAQRLLAKGDVLFQMVRPYQQNNYYFNLDGQYVASTGYAQIRTELNSKFIYYAVHEKAFLDEVMNRCTGTGYPAINSSDLSTIEIGIPCLEEQIKISNFLSAIDQKIEKVAQQIEETKQWKKGLLQQMFV